MSDRETDGVLEEVDATGDWGKIPYIALALIFSYLPDRDKFNASLVNSTWNEGFSWAGNWRQREMIFYGACEEMVVKEKAFAQRFGAHLRCLWLRCWSPAQGPALKAYLKNVGGVLEVLSRKASLREIHVCDLSSQTDIVADVEGLGFTDDELITLNDLLFESERRAEGKAKMAAALEKLLHAQTELRVLDLQEIDCAWEVGLRLISAAAKSSAAGTTLHTLCLSGTLNQPPSRLALSSPEYLAAMSSFRKLTHLRMDYRCLSCKLLDVLGAALGENLRKFAILCSEKDGLDLPNLEDDAWRTLASRCLFLKVELTIEGGNRNSGWRSTLLKSGMPLASLNLDGEMSSQHSEYWDTTSTLEHVFKEYRNTLEHLSLGLGQRSGGLSAEKLTSEMMSRALQLKRLKTLHLSGPMDCSVVRTLYDLLDETHRAENLKLVTLTVWCSSEEEIDNLIKTNRITALKRVSKQTEVRLIPML